MLSNQDFSIKKYPPETNIAPENGWLEYYSFLLGWPIFRAFAVSLREHS